jgi:hypothetical protein
VTRLAYLGLLVCQKRVIQGDAVGIPRSAINMLQRQSYVGRLSVCCKESHTG